MLTAETSTPESFCLRNGGHRDGKLVYFTHGSRGIAECPDCHRHYEREVREEEWKAYTLRDAAASRRDAA